MESVRGSTRGRVQQGLGSRGEAGLVGRETELSLIDDVLAALASGDGRLVLVAGEAGIGKTRLAEAAADRAREAGARVAWGRCWDAGGAPAYWPWIQVLRAILRDDEPVIRPRIEQLRDRLGPIMPELLAGAPPPVVDLHPDSERFLLFDAVAATLRAAAGSRRTVVILEDLHAADEPSLLLLRFAATELTDVPIAVFATYRDPELAADDPRQGLLEEIGRHPFVTRVRPAALAEPDVARMIQNATGHRPSALVSRAITRETEGNPLFATEVARLLADEGRLGTIDGLSDRLTIPEGVKAVIRRRLDRLSEGCRSMLQLASIIGREFDLELLANLGAEHAAALAAIDEAMTARVVQEGRGGIGRWRFAHALIREVLYESLSLPVRTGLHDRVGRALERLAGESPDELVSELAYHFVLAAPGGDTERAARYSRLAGQRATQSAAHEEAVRHFQNALAALELDRAAPEGERCRRLIDLGEAQSRAGIPNAPRTIREAAALAERLDLPDELARAAVAYGGRFMWARAGSDPYLVPLLERALRARGDREDALRIRLLARLAGALRDEHTMDRRAAISAEALEVARRIGDPTSLVHALSARFWAIWGPDHLDEMTTIAAEVDTLVDTQTESTADIERIGDARWMSISALSTIGHTPQDADRIFERFADAVERLRQPAHRWYLGVIRTVLALARGQFAGIDDLIEQTRTEGQIQAWDAENAYRLARFALARERDQLESIEPLIAAAVEDAPGYWLFPATRAWINAELGRLDESQRDLATMLGDGADRWPRDNNFLWAMVHLAEAAIRLGDRRSIEQLLEVLQPYRHLAASAAGEVVGGPVGRVVGDLAAELGRFEDAVAAHEEAFRFVRRAGWRPWEGWTHLSHGRVLDRRGHPGDDDLAREHFTKAAAIAEELGMPALAARARAELAEEASASQGVARNEREGVVAGRASTTTPSDVGRFVREGDVWVIEFGGRTTRLTDAKGLRYLARLLASPGREIPAIDLASNGPDTSTREAAFGRGTAFGTAVAGGVANAEPVLDATARTAYKSRLLELQEEIDEAESFGDRQRAALRREEFEAIASELTAATGLGGRARVMGSPAERARQSVTKAIRGALERIGSADPDLGAHLEHAVRTGAFCSYAPDPRSQQRWTVHGGV